MTESQLKNEIEKIPLGSNLQVVKNNGEIIEVRLASHEVSGTNAKDYGEIIVPALPPALTVQGGTRFGSFRIDAKEIVKIAWVD